MHTILFVNYLNKILNDKILLEKHNRLSSHADDNVKQASYINRKDKRFYYTFWH